MKSLRSTLAVTIGGLALLMTQEALAFKIVSFNGRFTRWEGDQLHYTLDKRGSRDFDGDALTGCDSSGACVTIQEAIRKSFDAWEQAPGADVHFTEDTPQIVSSSGYDHKNTIRWVDQGWGSLSFSPPSSALAVTICTYRTEDSINEDCDITFNGDDFHWAVINTTEEENSGVIDVQNIATHEIGHFIGLDHSSNDIFEADPKLYLATMFFASGPGETFRRELKEDDLAAVRNLYPASNVSEPVIESVSPGIIDASSAQSATVQIVGRGFVDNATALLTVGGDETDLVGNVVSVSDTEMTIKFDVSNLQSGKYDLVLANAYDRTDRLSAAVSITGGLGKLSPTSGENSQASTASGGCSIAVTDSSTAGLLSGLMMIFLPLVLIGTSRLVFAQISPKAKA